MTEREEQLLKSFSDEELIAECEHRGIYKNEISVQDIIERSIEFAKKNYKAWWSPEIEDRYRTLMETGSGIDGGINFNKHGIESLPLHIFRTVEIDGEEHYFKFFLCIEASEFNNVKISYKCKQANYKSWSGNSLQECIANASSDLHKEAIEKKGVLGIINPFTGNCTDSEGNHYIKNAPGTPPEQFRY